MRVLVTGAASGIGYATCVRIARDAAARGEAAKIAVLDVPGAALEAAATTFRDMGAEALAVPADLSEAAAPGRSLDTVLSAFGGLDALVSNAGTQAPGPIRQCSVADWDRVFAVNVRAAWQLASAAHEALADAHGSMVIVASMSGSNAHANLGPYAPSKAAVIMLARVLAQEFGPQGIRVNSVSPGMVRTGMTAKVYADAAVHAERDALVPLGRVGEADDIADAIAFLLGRDARYISGHDLVVDGAFTGNHLGRIPGLINITRG